MKEFIHKLIERLEELKKREMDREENITEDGYWEDCEDAFEDGESNGMYTAYTKAIQIVNQLAEEYNDGWISCSKRLPEENQRVIGCFAHGTVVELGFYDGLFHGIYEYNTNVIIAWQPLPASYQPKETSKDCNNCANNTELDEVDNGCYMCCKGFEDNFQPKGE